MGLHENEISERIIGAAIEVHKYFGPGLVEQVYEEALCHELSLHGIRFERQKFVPIHYTLQGRETRCAAPVGFDR